jgi:hypothetical protein
MARASSRPGYPDCGDSKIGRPGEVASGRSRRVTQTSSFATSTARRGPARAGPRISCCPRLEGQELCDPMRAPGTAESNPRPAGSQPREFFVSQNPFFSRVPLPVLGSSTDSRAPQCRKPSSQFKTPKSGLGDGPWHPRSCPPHQHLPGRVKRATSRRTSSTGGRSGSPSRWRAGHFFRWKGECKRLPANGIRRGQAERRSRKSWKARLCRSVSTSRSKSSASAKQNS